MKKPFFVITEILLSTLLVASAGAAAVIAVDLKTDMFHIDKLDPLHLNELLTNQNSTVSSHVSEISQTEIILQSPIQEPSQKETSQAVSVKEVSKKTEEISLIPEPDGQQEQPEELIAFMEAYEYSFEENLNGNKLILIEADNSSNTAKAKLYCYQKSQDGLWWNIAGENTALSEEVYIGQNGSSYEAKPDSKKTPAGIWTAGQGFYIADKPDTTYPLFEITEDTYWVTDEKSVFFNQKVEGIEDKDWSTAEHMIASEKSYQYGLVVNYNTEQPEQSKASAVFMHCGTAPTEGCIAVPANVMKTILEWLDKESTPLIWVTV